ncbi:MAG: hypothetical protein ACI352_02295 [Elusimicrobiaceae bacterium]|nr:hypothetical protein [Elusimicrobiota bacterium]
MTPDFSPALRRGYFIKGIFIIGAVFFSESFSALKIISTLLIIIGVVGLKLSGGA